MNVPHPLNQAVIAQALHDLRNGQLRRCLSIGFTEGQLAALKRPELLSVLSNAQVCWCRVTVNSAVVQRILTQAIAANEEVAAIDRMLRAGASTEMMSRYFGLPHQEVATRREVLGLPKRRGRHPALDEAQDVELWRRWKPQRDQRQIDTADETAMLQLALEIAEDMALPLSVVWSTIQGWVEQKLV
ncbi:Protein of unknown function [Pseudomonas cedrina]|uniref:Coproporphyrinogen III oxidase n=2 Tax=Pseudomonas cedrina TaxID=651740 RepID=A0A1V2JZP9_PSECE|nr:DUF2857 domain-containing protein [Pseudomonas cedrina]ONH50918.1 coproporphyrinogen III oxidase [Pseudomonas cedrina subsp. cedrina]SDS63542.1 Protein of unknown function [Pseudomonas cedrina]